MAEIRIIVDPLEEGQPGDSDLVVASEANYYVARRRLRRALAEDTGLVVWVRSEGLVTRFDDLSRDPRVFKQTGQDLSAHRGLFPLDLSLIHI